MSKQKTFLVSFVFNDDDRERDLMVVGVKRLNGSPDIVNAVQGLEVRDLYKTIYGKEKTDDRADA